MVLGFNHSGIVVQDLEKSEGADISVCPNCGLEYLKILKDVSL